MRRQHINLYTSKRITQSITDFDRWKYQRKNWFTDKMWNLLMKWGCLTNPIDTTESFERIAVDIDSISKAVMKCMEGMYYRRLTPSHIFMGPDEFDRHLSEPLAKEFMRNQIDFTIPMHQGGYKMYDIPVTVVPHMEGLLVV